MCKNEKAIQKRDELWMSALKYVSVISNKKKLNWIQSITSKNELYNLKEDLKKERN